MALGMDRTDVVRQSVANRHLERAQGLQQALVEFRLGRLRIDDGDIIPEEDQVTSGNQTVAAVVCGRITGGKCRRRS